MRRPRASLATSVCALAVVVAAAFGTLFIAGRGATTIVATNLASSRASDFRRTVELVHASPVVGRAHHLLLDPLPHGLDGLEPGDRLRVQVATGGRTQIVLVRDVGGSASRASALLAWVRGRASLQAVSDRAWVDLGPLPEDGTPMRRQVIGLLPGSFGFVMPNTPDDGLFSRAAIDRVDGGTAAVARTAPRYRVVRSAAASPAEAVARLGFFLGRSPVLALTAALATALLVFGWLALGRAALASVGALVAGAILLHAALLPPLQGADETSHTATIEFLGHSGRPVVDPLGKIPPAISRLAHALEQDRVQYNRAEPLPLAGPGERERLARELSEIDASSARVRRPPAAALQPTYSRAPLFYGPMNVLWPAFATLDALDRVALYRTLSASFAALLWFAGAVVLARLAESEQALLLYGGIPLLVPLVIATMANTSNFAPATGLGGLVAASAVAAILTRRKPARVAALAILGIAAVAGTYLWVDYALLLAGGAVAMVAGAVAVTLRRRADRSRRLAISLGGAAALVSGLLAILVGGDRIGIYRSIYLPEFGSAESAWMLASALAPLVWTGAMAGGALLHRHEPLTERRRHARRLCVAAWAAFIVAFLATPFTTVPYELQWLELPQLVVAYLGAFLSTNFAFAQDTLTWKLYWGAFGWHDTFYPAAVYALARWAFVALFLSLPVLGVRFVTERTVAAALLLLVAGAGLCFAVVSELARQVNMVHPIGRYLMPWLVVAALPVLVRLQAAGRERWFRLAVRAGVALHVWTVIGVVGGRYAFGAG